jgi:hypothetical protein
MSRHLTPPRLAEDPQRCRCAECRRLDRLEPYDVWQRRLLPAEGKDER